MKVFSSETQINHEVFLQYVSQFCWQVSSFCEIQDLFSVEFPLIGILFYPDVVLSIQLVNFYSYPFMVCRIIKLYMLFKA